MASASAILHSTDRVREREQARRSREAFDRALDELRRAKARLDWAANLYLERLEGTKRAERDS